jgi:hypothetical protein
MDYTNTKQMSDDCPICFEEIEDTNNVAITICRHKFHSTCLFRSVQSSGYRCPNCRGSLLSGPIASLLSGHNINSLYNVVTGAVGATGATGATGRASLYDISWNNINAMVQDAPTTQSSRQARTAGSYHNDSSDDDITGG